MKMTIFHNLYSLVFNLRKLPGWTLIVLGLGWKALDILGRIDVFLKVADSVGGTPALITSVLTSIWTSIVLVAMGTAYLIFVGEPQKGVQRQPWWPYVGYTIALIFFGFAATMVGYGALELYIRKEIAKGVSGLPRDTPANPQNESGKPLYGAPRALTENQKRLLIAELAKVRSELPSISITYLDGDMEAFAYADEIRRCFSRSAVFVPPLRQAQMGEPDWNGLLLEVPDANQPSAKAKTLQQTLLLIDIYAKFVSYPLNTGEAHIFVGPRVIQR